MLFSARGQTARRVHGCRLVPGFRPSFPQLYSDISWLGVFHCEILRCDTTLRNAPGNVGVRGTRDVLRHPFQSSNHMLIRSNVQCIFS